MPFWFLLPCAINVENNESGNGVFPRENVVFKPEAVAHVRALRLSSGDPIILTDGNGRAYRARLTSVGSGQVKAEVLEKFEKGVEPSLEIVLFAGISKGEKMERIVRQSVELGVKKIVPVLTERTVIRGVDGEKGKKKTWRWQNIATAAALQCRRSFVPAVLPPLNFAAALELMRESDLVIVPWEEEKRLGLHSLAENIKNPSAVGVFTGPEGGISTSEMEKLKTLPQAFAITLGPRILRAETAPLAVLSIIMYLWGDLSGKG